jgi:hypothetical protein
MDKREEELKRKEGLEPKIPKELEVFFEIKNKIIEILKDQSISTAVKMAKVDGYELKYQNLL